MQQSKKQLNIHLAKILKQEIKELKNIIKQQAKIIAFFNAAIFKLLDKGIITNDEIVRKIKEQQTAAKIKQDFRKTNTKNIRI